MSFEHYIRRLEMGRVKLIESEASSENLVYEVNGPGVRLHYVNEGKIKTMTLHADEALAIGIELTDIAKEMLGCGL